MFAGGVKYFPTLNLMLIAEHYESYPTFDDLIYSVFKLGQVHENLARVEYTSPRGSIFPGVQS
jgi:hypothetical protein